ncbi:hypothetical protein ASG25_10750 [Rhizobium sp. Leaf384]|nr:hypothetical protein ASG25_10750 [Rhizobium sp. Leaf384]
MIKTGMTMPAGIKPADQSLVYGYALDGVPICGLFVATQKLLKGDYAGNPDVLLGIIPKPPVLAALAKLEARVAREDLARKRDAVNTMTQKPPAIDRSAEVMARVRAVAGDFKASYEARKAAVRGAPETIPFGEDAAEYWSKIEALKDSEQGVSREQEAYRRKIASQLASVEQREPIHAA